MFVGDNLGAIDIFREQLAVKSSMMYSRINNKRPVSVLIHIRAVVSGFFLYFYLLTMVLSVSVYAPSTFARDRTAPDRHQDVYEKSLSNGLKIIVRPDHRAQVVVFQIWYKAGSAYEFSGLTGVSHAMEHMMQKGMKEFYNQDYVSRMLPGIGDSSAFTTRDYTSYYHLLEKNRLADIFRLEAWRMTDLSMSADSFKTEMQVIQEERRQHIEDIPEALLYEQFCALAYTHSGYQQPVIGWMTDIQNLQLQDLTHWYRQYYRPDNATLVVVGDIEPDKVFALAKHYFSNIQPSRSLPARPEHKALNTGSRRFIMSSPVSFPYIIIGFKVPSLVTADRPGEAYALDLLASILDGGDNTRFSRDLIRHHQLAVEMSVEYELYAQRRTLFIIQGIPNTGVTASDLEQAILSEIERLKEEPVSEQELTRIKTQIIAAEIFERDQMLNLATKTGIAETIGIGWQQDNDYIEHIQSVTPRQLQRVAKKYFNTLNSTTALMRSSGETTRTSHPSRTGSN